MRKPAVGEARKLLAEGMSKRSVEELAKLLEHPHQQVRLEAQFELVRRAHVFANRWCSTGVLLSPSRAVI